MSWSISLFVWGLHKGKIYKVGWGLLTAWDILMNTHHHCHLMVVSHSENAMTEGIHRTSRLFSGGWFQKILPVDAKERAVTDRSIALRPKVTWKLRFLAGRHRDHRSKTTRAYYYIPLLLFSSSAGLWAKTKRSLLLFPSPRWSLNWPKAPTGPGQPRTLPYDYNTALHKAPGQAAPNNTALHKAPLPFLARSPE